MQLVRLVEAKWGDNTAAGIIPFCKEERKFLVLKRAKGISQGGTWCPPGGKMDPGEVSPADTAFREFCEETGYAGGLDSIELVPLLQFRYRPDGFIFYNFLGIVDEHFEADPQGKHAKESEDFSWLTLDELVDLEPKHPGFLALLNDDTSYQILSKAEDTGGD